MDILYCYTLYNPCELVRTVQLNVRINILFDTKY